MDSLVGFMEVVRKLDEKDASFRGLLHILIGRRIELADGTKVSVGLTWREAAELLKRVRWDKDAVVELGLNSEELPPRDRGRYWFTAIQTARLDSHDALAAGDALATILARHGYRIGPAPKYTK